MAVTRGWGAPLLLLAIVLIVMPAPAAAFGAGNIPSIAQVEGHNWRHGDIEDMLKQLAFLHGKKWTTMLVSRTYFGNWLRDYSQAVDVGSLKGVNAPTIRILVWVLSFMSFGYATEEFEVTEERLGVYRPEEHIDNPLGYADGIDARTLDKRLRGPVDPRETQIDPRTGMKNYIANEQGGWATSAGYLRFSFARSIHFGRLYTSGNSGKGKEEDLCEALRCLGQALHCMEDFSAHSNYCELALIEMGHRNVFPHVGTSTQINLNGKHVWPLVTGTFGGVDFLHSVLGEATDTFTQSEVDEMNSALQNAQQITTNATGVGGGSSRGLFGSSRPSSSSGGDFISLISQIPGIGGGFASDARNLQAEAAAQESRNRSAGTTDRANLNQVPGMSASFDPVETARKIYPILEFRDKIVRNINSVIVKIPGLESLLEHIGETLTAFILGLLAPFVRPIINEVSKALKTGSSGVISASDKSQLLVWKDPSCSDPTHSMLSKDHFTNVLNSCAGRVAATVLQYVVPRILYAWENPGVPVEEVVNDVLRVFHHPAARDERCQIQREMFETVRKWAGESDHRHQLDHLLSSESVKTGKNHILTNVKDGKRGGGGHSHDHGALGGHGKVAGSLWAQVKTRDMDAMGGRDGNPRLNYESTSPAPATASMHRPPGSPGYGYDNRPSTGGGYGQSAPPENASYYGGGPQGPSYGGGPQGGYGGQQQYPPAQPSPYGNLPPSQGGYWNTQQQQPPPPQQQPPYPPQGYGYNAPQQYPPQQQQQPYPPQHHQHPPPQNQGGGWSQYPGQHPYR